MRADRLQTNTYPISHRPARAALCLLLGAYLLEKSCYRCPHCGKKLDMKSSFPKT